MIKNVIDTIDVGNILNALNEINDIVWTDYIQGRQTGLQHKLGEDPWTSSVGKSQGNELEYTELNPLFKNTIFETII